ncbi:hypothetical protein D3C84_733190 [compost metagenome]
MISDFTEALRLADSVRLRRARSKCHSSTSPSVQRPWAVPDAAGSPASLAVICGSTPRAPLVFSPGKRPILCHLPASTTCQVPRERSLPKRKCREG